MRIPDYSPPTTDSMTSVFTLVFTNLLITSLWANSTLTSLVQWFTRWKYLLSSESGVYSWSVILRKPKEGREIHFVYMMSMSLWPINSFLSNKATSKDGWLTPPLLARTAWYNRLINVHSYTWGIHSWSTELINFVLWERTKPPYR